MSGQLDAERARSASGEAALKHHEELAMGFRAQTSRISKTLLKIITSSVIQERVETNIRARYCQWRYNSLVQTHNAHITSMEHMHNEREITNKKGFQDTKKVLAEQRRLALGYRKNFNLLKVFRFAKFPARYKHRDMRPHVSRWLNNMHEHAKKKITEEIQDHLKNLTDALEESRNTCVLLSKTNSKMLAEIQECEQAQVRLWPCGASGVMGMHTHGPCCLCICSIFKTCQVKIKDQDTSLVIAESRIKCLEAELENATKVKADVEGQHERATKALEECQKSITLLSAQLDAERIKRASTLEDVSGLELTLEEELIKREMQVADLSEQSKNGIQDLQQQHKKALAILQQERDKLLKENGDLTHDNAKLKQRFMDAHSASRIAAQEQVDLELQLKDLMR